LDVSKKLYKMSDEAAPTATYEEIDDELFTMTLTHENKKELFGEAISKLAHGSDQSTSILENLNKWNPDVAASFTPRSSSTILETPFRLMFPASALPSFKETGLYVRQYIAISYCWHSDEFLPDGYERHGSWPIRKQFVDAILEDKDHPREGIWMDQICIDQSDPINKGKSIASMDIIYRSCIRLVILLEDIFLDEQEAALLGKYDSTEMAIKSKWTGEDKNRGIYSSLYQKVNATRWWTRAWCLHEFGVNDAWTTKRQANRVHNATFIVNGPNGSTVKIKWWDLQCILGTALDILSTVDNDILLSFNGQYIFSGVESGIELDDSTSRRSIMARHFGVNSQGSTYLADRLSIILNMCSMGLAYIGPEPRTEHEVLYFSSLLALASGEVYPLSMFHGQSMLLDDKPTWLARPILTGDTSIRTFKVRDVKSIHRISMEDIELDMIFFKFPVDEMKNLSSTYTIFPSTVPTTQPTRRLPAESPGIAITIYSETDVDLSRRRFLAGCIRNGYTFTARLWKQLKRDVVVPHYQLKNGVFEPLAPNPQLKDAARLLLSHLIPVSNLLCIPPPDTFSFEDALFFLTWFTDPRSRWYISAFTFCLPCSRRDDQAFVTAVHVNEYWNDGPVEELQLAVPTDLLDTTCEKLRVWIMRPGKNGKWRLVAKALLLGEPDMMSEARASVGREGAVVTLRERVVVTGSATRTEGARS
jgi:hypothetical protein